MTKNTLKDEKPRKRVRLSAQGRLKDMKDTGLNHGKKGMGIKRAREAVKYKEAYCELKYKK